jgi:hypothetical protein
MTFTTLPSKAKKTLEWLEIEPKTHEDQGKGGDEGGGSCAAFDGGENDHGDMSAEHDEIDL